MTRHDAPCVCGRRKTRIYAAASATGLSEQWECVCGAFDRDHYSPDGLHHRSVGFIPRLRIPWRYNVRRRYRELRRDWAATSSDEKFCTLGMVLLPPMVLVTVPWLAFYLLTGYGLGKAHR